MNLYLIATLSFGSLFLMTLFQGTTLAQESPTEDFGIYPGRVGHAGHYSNLTYGIEDLVIPSGWVWQEIIDNSDLLLRINPVSSLAELANGTDSGPSIVLSIQTKAQISLFNPFQDCFFRESNSTSLIDGLNFIVSSPSCNFGDHSILYKIYQYSAPGKIVDLHLNFPTNEMDPSFLNKYIAVLDSIAQTMRLKD